MCEYKYDLMLVHVDATVFSAIIQVNGNVQDTDVVKQKDSASPTLKTEQQVETVCVYNMCACMKHLFIGLALIYFEATQRCLIHVCK